MVAATGHVCRNGLGECGVGCSVRADTHKAFFCLTGRNTLKTALAHLLRRYVTYIQACCAQYSGCVHEGVHESEQEEF